MAKRAKNRTGKKARWSEKRKAKENAFLQGRIPASEPPPGRKRKVRSKLETKVALTSDRASGATAVRGKKKMNRRKSKQSKQVDEMGDTIVEHDFNDSEDEEEEEIKRELAEKRQRELAAAAKGQRQVFVTGIPWSASEERLTKFFKKRCGAVAEVSYPMDDKGRPKGFAFITFETEGAVAKALACDGQEYRSRKITVKVPDKRKAGGKDGEDDDSEGSSLNSDDDSS